MLKGAHSFNCHPHVYPQMERAILSLLRKHSPDGATPACSLLFIYRSGKDERLSWPVLQPTYCDQYWQLRFPGILLKCQNFPRPQCHFSPVHMRFFISSTGSLLHAALISKWPTLLSVLFIPFSLLIYTVAFHADHSTCSLRLFNTNLLSVPFVRTSLHLASKAS